MKDKFKKTLSVAVTGFITYAVIDHPGKEEPHIHHEPHPIIFHQQNDSSFASVASTDVNLISPDKIKIIQ